MGAKLLAQNRTVTGALPLDRPHAARPHRLYVATTNHCNRACPWCSTYSSPKGKSWISLEAYRATFPDQGAFEVQLEGGEPTIHPQFDELVAAARGHERCTRLIVVTNGVVLPRAPAALREWVARLGAPLTLKLSINHHLLKRDPALIELAAMLRAAMAQLGGDRELVLNVRLRKGAPGDDRFVLDAVESAGLIDLANVFFLQRYGFGERYGDWEEPFVVGENFSLVNPDGSLWGPDLVARSRAMRDLG